MTLYLSGPTRVIVLPASCPGAVRKFMHINIPFCNSPVPRFPPAFLGMDRYVTCLRLHGAVDFENHFFSRDLIFQLNGQEIYIEKGTCEVMCAGKWSQ